MNSSDGFSVSNLVTQITDGITKNLTNNAPNLDAFIKEGRRTRNVSKRRRHYYEEVEDYYDNDIKYGRNMKHRHTDDYSDEHRRPRNNPEWYADDYRRPRCDWGECSEVRRHTGHMPGNGYSLYPFGTYGSCYAHQQQHLDNGMGQSSVPLYQVMQQPQPYQQPQPIPQLRASQPPPPHYVPATATTYTNTTTTARGDDRVVSIPQLYSGFVITIPAADCAADTGANDDAIGRSIEPLVNTIKEALDFYVRIK
jgi:hypothetical protein